MTDLTDEQIDKIILNCPLEGYALIASMRDDVTVADFRNVVRAFTRGLIASAAVFAEKNT